MQSRLHGRGYPSAEFVDLKGMDYWERWMTIRAHAATTSKEEKEYVKLEISS
jgi:hypothetical protein